MSLIHVSLDLETLSTRPDAVVLSIGGAARVDGELTSFYAPAGKEEQTERHLDPNTLAWWKKRGSLWDEIWQEHSDAPPLSTVLDNLQTWIASMGTDDDEIFVWGNGANFDVAILEHAYKTYGRLPPWAFWNVRDLRTLKHLAELKGVFTKPVREGTHHNARDDAIYQLAMIENHWDLLVS